MSDWEYTPNAPIGILLEDYAQRLRNKCQATPGLAVTGDANVFVFYLAHVFYSDVSSGGFYQLLVKLRGNYLPEIENALLSLHAMNAHKGYTSAVKMCVQRVVEYEAMLAGNPDGTGLKDDLTLHSLEYLRSTPAFLEEAEVELRKLRKDVEVWLQRSHQS